MMEEEDLQADNEELAEEMLAELDDGEWDSLDVGECLEDEYLWCFDDGEFEDELYRDDCGYDYSFG